MMAVSDLRPVLLAYVESVVVANCASTCQHLCAETRPRD